jgi:hypothetical protein
MSNLRNLPIRAQLRQTVEQVQVLKRPAGWFVEVEAPIVERASAFGAPLHAIVRASVGPFGSWDAARRAAEKVFKGEASPTSAVLGVASGCHAARNGRPPFPPVDDDDICDWCP